MSLISMVQSDLDLFYSSETFFAESVTYKSLNEDKNSYTDTTILVNLSRKQENLFDEMAGQEVSPAHLFLKTTDITDSKFGDVVIDSKGVEWVLKIKMSEDFGQIKWLVHSKEKGRIKRYGGA